MDSPAKIQSDIPKRAGVGLKSAHYETILEDLPNVGWFEIHAENYMGAGGAPHRYLERIRQNYPISLHGVGLSIGADRPLDREHLARLRNLNERYQPGLFSEHLAWSTHDDFFFNDLLPVPYTPEALMLLENPSTYVTFAESSMTEIEFLREITERTGCGLLLDVNNVFVSATNHGYSPEDYIDAFPIERAGEIHLGGHARDEDDTGAPLLIDAHDRAVADPVWALYSRAIARTGGIPTLIEWDNDLPTWQELFAEAQTADALLMQDTRGQKRVAG